MGKDKLEIEKVQQQATRFICNNYYPMYNITAMIDQLKWQKLGITLVYACFSAPNSCSY